MKTLGATIALRNGIEYDFCFEECIASLLPVCEEIVVAESQSTDGTRARLEEMAKAEPKIKIYDYPYTNPVGDPCWVMNWTNFAREKLTTDYNIQMDADEVLHESAYDRIMSKIQGREVSLLCRRWNFWKDHRHLIPLGECCAAEVLRVCPTKYWLAADFPDSRGRESMDIQIGALDVCIYHYGFIRKRKAFFEKEEALQRAFFNDYDPNLKKAETYDGNWMQMPGLCSWNDQIIEFNGPHPLVAHKWLTDRGYEL